MEAYKKCRIFAPINTRSMTESQLHKKYRSKSLHQLRTMILCRDEESDLVAYYLLRYKLFDKLTTIYIDANIADDISDVLLDFYLYIKEGGKDSKPYQCLESVRSVLSLERYLLNMFRNFVTDRWKQSMKEEKAKTEFKSNTADSYNHLRDRRIEQFGWLLAYANEEMPVRERFIFFRNLLATLDKSIVISNERMADAMGLTYSNYRQIDSRCRKEIVNRLEDYQHGVIPDLTEVSQHLVQQVVTDFENTGNILVSLYDSTLAQLDCKAKIEYLRQEEMTGSSTPLVNEAEEDSLRYSLKEAQPVNYVYDETPLDYRNSRFRRVSSPAIRTEDLPLAMDFSDLRSNFKPWDALLTYLSKE